MPRKVKVTEIPPEIVAPPPEKKKRAQTEYNRFVSEKMKDPGVKALPVKERMKKIGELWRALKAEPVKIEPVKIKDHGNQAESQAKQKRAPRKKKQEVPPQA